MEKHPDRDKHNIFEDDDLDKAIANVDDTGLVKSEQEINEFEELENLRPPEEE